MSRHVVIYHAFNGFLYFPLFLAQELDLLPKGTELVWSGSDDKAVEGLWGSLNKENIDIAICDPLAGNVKNINVQGIHDPIITIGLLISTVPFWICSLDSLADQLQEEADFLNSGVRVKHIIAYKDGNTGFVFAKRFCSVNKINPDKIIQVEFGDEFKKAKELIDQGVHPGDILVISADAIKVSSLNGQNGSVIYSYASSISADNPSPYGFTGFLITQSTLRSSCVEATQIIYALKQAVIFAKIALSSNDNTLFERIVKLYDNEAYRKIFSQLGILNSSERINLVKGALHMLMTDSNAYKMMEEPPSINDLKMALISASDEWREHAPRKIGERIGYGHSVVPGLMTSQHWDLLMKNHYAEFFRSKPIGGKIAWTSAMIHFFNIIQILAIVVAMVFHIGAFLETYLSLISELDLKLIAVEMVLFITAIGCFVWGNKYRKAVVDTEKGFPVIETPNTIFAIWLAVCGINIAVLFIEVDSLSNVFQTPRHELGSANGHSGDQ